jgi:hypothetical protein
LTVPNGVVWLTLFSVAWFWAVARFDVVWALAIAVGFGGGGGVGADFPIADSPSGLRALGKV